MANGRTQPHAAKTQPVGEERPNLDVLLAYCHLSEIRSLETYTRQLLEQGRLHTYGADVILSALDALSLHATADMEGPDNDDSQLF